VVFCLLWLAGTPSAAGQSPKVVSSYGTINQDTTFEQIKAACLAVKTARALEHLTLLNSRYDLSTKISAANLMSGGKSMPLGPTASLQGSTWEQLDKLTPDQIKAQGQFPYPPLPFADHAEGGILFPEMITMKTRQAHRRSGKRWWLP
jgi:hypothetical protein